MKVAIEYHREKSSTKSSQIVEILLRGIPRPLRCLDMTYGKGNFWKWQHDGITVLAADIEGGGTFSDGVMPWDFRSLPVDITGQFDLVAFDPPHTAAGCSAWSHAYGICRQHGGPRDQRQIGDDLMAGASEAFRVSSAYVLIKFKDCVESGRQWHHWPGVIKMSSCFSAAWNQGSAAIRP